MVAAEWSSKHAGVMELWPAQSELICFYRFVEKLNSGLWFIAAQDSKFYWSETFFKGLSLKDEEREKRTILVEITSFSKQKLQWGTTAPTGLWISSHQRKGNKRVKRDRKQCQSITDTCVICFVCLFWMFKISIIASSSSISSFL